MSELDDIQPVDDPPQATLTCPVCRNGVALPPEFNLPSVQCPTCGSVFGRLTGQVISGPMMHAGPYRSPVSPVVSGRPQGPVPVPRGPAYPMSPMPMAPAKGKGKTLGAVIGAVLAVVAMIGIRYTVREWLSDDEPTSWDEAPTHSPRFDLADIEIEPEPMRHPATQWHTYRSDAWKFKCLFPSKPGESRKDDSTTGRNLQISAEYDDSEYSVECLHDPDTAARIAPNPREYATQLAAELGDAPLRTGRGGEVNARATYRVDVPSGDWVRALMVVADGENVFILRCRFAKSEPRMGGVFFGSFMLLTSKLGASKGAPDADSPLALYFIGSPTYSPGSPYNAVLVARNGGDYSFELLVNELPQGITATVNGDKVDVKGTSDLDTGGTLKVRVNSGDQSAEYELILRASGRD